MTTFHWKQIKNKLTSIEFWQQMSKIVVVANKSVTNLASEALDAIFGILAKNHAEWSHRDLPNRSGSPFPGTQPK